MDDVSARKTANRPRIIIWTDRRIDAPKLQL